jgi:hypothetical protein
MSNFRIYGLRGVTLGVDRSELRLVMDLNWKDAKKATISLIYQAGVGIGVVFVALLAVLPDAWDRTDLRVPFVWYFLGVSFSLIAVVHLVLATAFNREEPGWMRRFMMNAGIAGLFIFAASTILFAGYLVHIAR